MNTPVATIQDGQLRGTVEALCDGSSYYSFKGIPYAEPPIGKLRFRAPLPVKPWEGIRNAIEHGPTCPQSDFLSGTIVKGDENCLFLNVYTKSLKPESKLPVMVFIHGGAYAVGSGNSEMYGPEFLLQHDVILVTFNYRLELFGFLCLDTPEVPGNAGMKDQVAALRWVQKNISQFGGDPDNVTIFGESAGGMSVTFHMLSPMSSGLFHKVIAQSGVCIMDLTIGKNSVEKAFKAGNFLGTETTDTAELLQYLENLPVEKIIDPIIKKVGENYETINFEVRFIPVVEKKFPNVEAFIEEPPLDMMLANKISKVPLIVGHTSAEGILDVKNYLEKIDLLNKNPSCVIQKSVAENIKNIKLKELGDRLKQFYIGNRDFTTKDLDVLCTLAGDLYFVYDSHRFAHIYSKLCKQTYLYRFHCDTELNLLKKMFGMSSIKGAAHGDDIFYIFHGDRNKELYLKNDKIKDVIKKVTLIWTNFAKTGNPTPDADENNKWYPYTIDNKEYFHFADTFSMGDFSDGDNKRMDLHNQFYIEAGLPSME